MATLAKDASSSSSSKVKTNVSSEQTKVLKEIMESNTSTITDAEKLKKLNKSYQEMIKKTRTIETAFALTQHKIDTLTNERDIYLQEKTNLAARTEKLEKLCRVLQETNKKILEENKNSLLIEQEKRKEQSEKFEKSISSISTQIESQAQERIKEAKDNETLRNKLKKIIEEFQLREEHFKNQLKTEDLKRQLAEAQHKQKIASMQEEMTKVELYKKQIEIYNQSEQQYKDTINLYNEKFESFNGTLSESNKSFVALRSELEKVNKLKKRSDIENKNLKAREVTYIKQKDKLSDLCKLLQKERGNLRKENNNLKFKLVKLKKQFGVKLDDDDDDNTKNKKTNANK